ncbi:hypothetical protein ACERJO_17475 [Halalkalibacter sp. AB-rgal2]|uniref:ATP-binding protein n=1 Tax=Halalkalibacter sp. AB-rgal2 TaxID=3242695 RepID=UPI00359E3465
MLEMKVNNDNWLPHLQYSLPPDVTSYKFDIYAIALEGWRRGLSLKFISRKRGANAFNHSLSFSLSNGEREHHFKVSRGDLVSKQAIDDCQDKGKTYNILRENHIPVPEGNVFGKDHTKDEMKDYANKLGFPIVVKPTNLSSGRGVATNLQSVEEVEQAIDHIINEYQVYDIVIERYITGLDHRVYVVGNKVSGVVKFLSANVIGDGKSTITELVERKNQIKKSDPRHVSNARKIQMNDDMIDFLNKQGLTLKSKIEKGKRIFLRAQGSYVKEREPVDVTDTINPTFKQYAINAVRSIEGLKVGSVDMIVDDEKGTCFINEVNSRPQIAMHLYPLEGKARDLPKDIIDYYFPETIDQRNEKFHFDFKSIYTMLDSGFVKEAFVPNIPNYNIFTKKYYLNGKYVKRLKNKIRRKAIQNNICGYVKEGKENDIVLLASGRKFEILKFEEALEQLINSSSRKIKIQKGNLLIPKKSKKIGFDIV